MKTKFLVLIVFFGLCNSVIGQVISENLSGEITYESRANRYERAKNILHDAALESPYQEYLQVLAKDRFAVKEYTLKFDDKSGLYSSVSKDNSKNNLDFYIDFPTEYVYRDLSTDSVFIQKNVIGESMFIKDKGISIKWKFTNERMDIGGYECRRANGVLNDSIYVVAFYSEEIQVPLGPSIFGGLPGIILGISIPHDNINIFAKNILLQETVVQSVSYDAKKTKNIDGFITFMKELPFSNPKRSGGVKFNIRTSFL
ncbi:GLPGLI family protein [Sphingobacterium sp. JUb20]|nr:GLPGLI family protein [Sphingobacterium sp. JUb20]